MLFYSDIADVYDYIFPLNQSQVQFVNKFINSSSNTILDIGCATGSLAVELAKAGHAVTGIDFDDKMIEKARSKADASKSYLPSMPSFKRMDMRKIPDHFKADSFDTVLCCGNTLVHLSDLSEIRHFLTQIAVLLRKEGVFLIQIINYNRILDKNIDALSTIENDKVRFERYYEREEDSNLLRFRTVLTIFDSGQKIENAISLYPLRKDKLEELLHPAGFESVEFFGSFEADPFTLEAVPLIVKATL